MAPVLPSCLSPHICILSSPDLSDLLVSSSLPSLPQLLQSFSPLPSVNTRSISLTSIPHTSFSLRFSDLQEIESACREDEDQRAVRTLDWIGDRVNKHCAKWVEDIEISSDQDTFKTPWWNDLRRCAEGEHVPSKTEGWNHPVTVIFAASTTSPNPLQAITALHSRALDLPSWVDTTLFRYTLIIHPRNSSLSDEEAGALFNAVKKQYGLHSYLLSLELPSPPPVPVAIPPFLPRLPSLVPESSTGVDRSPVGTPQPNIINTLRLSEGDIQQIAKFTREFVVMSLVPWMEKCVLEWNENFSSTRRLPSRLFSSTRRLFGSPSPSPAPTHNTSSSFPSSRPSYSTSAGQTQTSIPPPSQQRRLAEFSTILGDYKLAITVWEALRKDGRGGAFIGHSPHTRRAYFFHPKVLLRCLAYVVRWEAGIPVSELLSDILGGERWFVWAAGDTEELPSALLVAHAALLCALKGSKRRSAFWYLIAANKLEKLGIKPLTIYFLRKARDLYLAEPVRLLSPSFWDTDYESSSENSHFNAILAGIEHPLGRLLYTTGDIASAVKLFIGLLRGSTTPYETIDAQGLVPDKLYLEDFKTAFSHMVMTGNDQTIINQLQLPIRLCQPRDTQVRLRGNYSKQDDSTWQRREEAWQSFRRKHGGKEGLEKSGKAMIGETFWVDLVVQNPLDADIQLSNFTVSVEEETGTLSSEPLAKVDIIDDMILAAKEKKKVSIAIKPLRPVPLVLSHITYDFLSLLPSTEQLAYRGRRLHPANHEQKHTYGPDIGFKVAVVDAKYRLAASFMGEMTFIQGEYKDIRILLSNTGTRPISEVWLVADGGDEIWLGEALVDHDGGAPESEILHSSNSLVPDVAYRIPGVATEETPLQPGDSREVTIKLRAEGSGKKEFSWLLTYRERNNLAFQSVRLYGEYEVQILFELAATAHPCSSMEYSYILDVEVANSRNSDLVELFQISTLSPTWNCSGLKQETIPLHPSQSSRILIAASPWINTNSIRETLGYVSSALGDMISGRDVQQRQVPSINLLCNHVMKTEDVISVRNPMIQHFVQHRRQQLVSQNVAESFPHLAGTLHSAIFPLYNPFAVDVLVFWRISSQNRSGHALLTGLTLGARHAAMKDMLESAENIKATRSIYTETQREKTGILESIRNSEWNVEMDPLTIVVQGQGNITHDFSKGPCIVPVSIILQNYSLTHSTRFVLKFPMVQERSSQLIPTYMGRTTFRGILGPSQSTIVKPKLWITRAGIFNIGEWYLTTEIFQSTQPPQTPLRRYNRRSSPEEKTCLTISEIHTA
ncbi:hypothetical protein APHAL10511_006116 [Amanita phalloides]|nr:hypothetical protein APHAL10511_006116 [Amanita phalloides]